MSVSLVDTSLSMADAHCRLGHIPPDAVKRLCQHGLITGLTLNLDTELTRCNSCAHAKLTCKPVPKERNGKRADSPGAEVHTDVWGPSPVKSLGGKLYYISFTDDKTRYTRVYLLALKSEAFKAYLSFEAWLKTQHGTKIKQLHSDRSGEYLSNEFDAHLATHGIERRLTIHDTPQENGVAERLNHTLLEKVHAMLHSAQLPKYLWGEALMHAVWLKNRTSTKALADSTPLESLTSIKPDMSSLQEWGRRILVHDSTNSKLDGRAKVGKWVGYDTENRASRIYWPDKRSVSVERNIKFDLDHVLVTPLHSSIDTGPLELP